MRTKETTCRPHVMDADTNSTDGSSGSGSNHGDIEFPVLDLNDNPSPHQFSPGIEIAEYLPPPELSFWDPVGANVPLKIKEKIWAGQFIDFSILLKSEREANRDLEAGELKVKNQRMVLESGQKLGNFLDIEEWTSAFMVFMSVMLEKYRTRSQELLKYMRDIRLASKRSDRHGWGTYDEQFRLRKQRDPHSSWGIINQEYWLLYVTRENNAHTTQQVHSQGMNSHQNYMYAKPSQSSNYQQQNTGRPVQTPNNTYSNNRPMGRNPAANSTQNVRYTKTNTVQYCRYYNQGLDCQFFPRCRYLHQCESCGGKHRRTQCRSANRPGQFRQ